MTFQPLVLQHWPFYSLDGLLKENCCPHSPLMASLCRAGSERYSNMPKVSKQSTGLFYLPT